MAIIIRGKTRCSLCSRVLAAGEEIVGFSACLEPGHPLWQYSDSAMHRSCYEAWPEHDTFGRLHQEALAKSQSPAAVEEARDEWNARRAAEVQRDLEHNVDHDRIMELVTRDGASCPHCGRLHARYRELNETARKRLVCLLCHRSCNAAELQVGAR